MSIKINKDNYELYKKVWGIINQHLHKDLDKLLQRDINPILVLDTMAKTSHSLARKGLQAGLNDVLSGMKHCPEQILTNINQDLEQQDLPNLRAILNSANKTVIKVLNTKKIKNENEYYIIKELLDDTTSEISNKDRKTLSTSLLDYEAKAANK